MSTDMTLKLGQGASNVFSVNSTVSVETSFEGGNLVTKFTPAEARAHGARLISVADSIEGVAQKRMFSRMDLKELQAILHRLRQEMTPSVTDARPPEVRQNAIQRDINNALHILGG